MRKNSFRRDAKAQTDPIQGEKKFKFEKGGGSIHFEKSPTGS